MKRLVPVAAAFWLACAPAPESNSIDPCPPSIETLTVEEETVGTGDWNHDSFPDRLVVDRSACGARGDCPYALYLSCGPQEPFAAWTAYAQQVRIEGDKIVLVERQGKTGAERLTETRIPIPAPNH